MLNNTLLISSVLPMSPFVKLVLCGPICDFGNYLQAFAYKARQANGLPPLLPIVINSPDQHAEFEENPPGEDCIVISNFPPEKFRQAILQSNVAVVLYSQPLPAALEYSMQDLKYDFYSAARQLNQSLSILVELLDHRRKLILGHEADSDDLSLANLIATTFEDTGFSVLTDQGETPAFPKRQGENLREKQRTELTAICHGFFDAIAQTKDVVLFWPLSFFRDADGLRSPPPPGFVDLVGPARVLYYGPYLHLPPGEWQAQVYFGLKNLVGPSAIRIDICSGHITQHTASTVVDADGFFMLEFNVEIAPTDNFLEFRLILDQGEIEGKLIFGGIHLKIDSRNRAHSFRDAS